MRSNFANLLKVIEALRGQEISDDEPLRKHMPGLWPTMGDLRKLVRDAKLEREP